MLFRTCLLVAILLPLQVLSVSKKPYPKHLEDISYWTDKLFKPQESETFRLVYKDGVDLHYLDKTNFRGYDGQDFVTMGPYTVETRLGLLTQCNTPLCSTVDGILGFGWTDRANSAALLKTLSSSSRSDWGIEQPADFLPMPRRFAFTASHDYGELQLGGYDPMSIDASDTMNLFHMVRDDYGVKIESIKYGSGPNAVELLQFQPDGHPLHRTGCTTCVLMPNTTVNGVLKASPFELLLEQQLNGVEQSLFYTLPDVYGVKRVYEIEYDVCVSPSAHSMILGDPWFRKWIVYHDLSDLSQKTMGLALRAPEYKLMGEVPFDDDNSEASNVLGHGSRGVTDDDSDEESQDSWSEQSSAAAADRRGVHGKRTHNAKAAAAARARRNSQALAAGGQKAPAKIGARRWLAEKVHERELARLLELAVAPDAQEQEYGYDDMVEKVGLTSHRRVVYNVPLEVGTPPQLKEVVFDTGSYMFAIFSDPPPAEAVAPQHGPLPHFTLAGAPDAASDKTAAATAANPGTIREEKAARADPIQGAAAGENKGARALPAADKMQAKARSMAAKVRAAGGKHLAAAAGAAAAGTVRPAEGSWRQAMRERAGRGAPVHGARGRSGGDGQPVVALQVDASVESLGGGAGAGAGIWARGSSTLLAAAAAAMAGVAALAVAAGRRRKQGFLLASADGGRYGAAAAAAGL